MAKITFDWARPGQSSVFLGITGPTGSGKTKSALRVAEGLKGKDGVIYMIDTEGGRGGHYAKEHRYKHGLLDAPFTYERYLEAIKATGARPEDVVIVDSASHAHEGPGGLLEQHEAELDRMAGQDWKRREAVKFAAWIKPKAQFTRFVNDLQQYNRNVIMCFRAKEKMAMVQGKKGMEPVSIGWQPICTEGLAFEMTAMLVLPPGSEGKPDLGAEARKMPSYLKQLFTATQLSEDTGRKLRAWADEGDIKTPPARSSEASKPVEKINTGPKPGAESQPQAEPEGDPRGDIPSGFADTGASSADQTPSLTDMDTRGTDAPKTPSGSAAVDHRIFYTNDLVALLQSDVGEFLRHWNGISQDEKYDNMSPAMFQRIAVELSKVSDGDIINSWVQTLTDEERNVLAPVRETVRENLRKRKGKGK